MTFSLDQKQCNKCALWFDHIYFQKGHNRCNACRDAYMVAWRNQNREKINVNQRRYQETFRGRASVLLEAARKRAAKKNETFLLNHSDIEKGISIGFCVRTGLAFDLTYYGRNRKYSINPLSPSVDKIDPRGIYEPSNVQYVCSWYNLAKGQMSDDDVLRFCRQIVSLRND